MVQTTKFQIDIKKIANGLLDGVEKGVILSLKELETKINQNSPVDTGNYKAHNKNMGVKREGNKLIGTIRNDSDIAVQVEYAFRSTPVNWHPQGEPIYRDRQGFLGARVYTRSLDELRSKIINNIKKTG